MDYDYVLMGCNVRYPRSGYAGSMGLLGLWPEVLGVSTIPRPSPP